MRSLNRTGVCHYRPMCLIGLRSGVDHTWSQFNREAYQTRGKIIGRRR
jgi:hypothetical protein